MVLKMVENFIVKKIWRAFRDYNRRKYPLIEGTGVYHVHELVSCKYKSELIRDIPELANPLKPLIFIGEAIDNFLKEIFTSDEELEKLTETVEGVFQKQIKVNDGTITIIGKPDIVLRDMVIEVKYTSYIEDLPREQHIHQLKLYMYLTGKEKGKILYVTASGLKEFDVDEAFNETEVIEYFKSWGYPRFEWECRYCNYKQICPHFGDNRVVGEEADNN